MKSYILMLLFLGFAGCSNNVDSESYKYMKDQIIEQQAYHALAAKYYQAKYNCTWLQAMNKTTEEMQIVKYRLRKLVFGKYE